MQQNMSAPESNLFMNPSAARDSSPASVMLHKDSVRQLAPIALFVYNRPEHTRRTVESLKANILARQSDLFVFSDAAKKESAAAVEAVRKFIHHRRVQIPHHHRTRTKLRSGQFHHRRCFPCL